MKYIRLRLNLQGAIFAGPTVALSRAQNDQIADGIRQGAQPFSKNTQAADGKFTSRHMNVFQLNIPGLYRYAQLYVVMRYIGPVIPFIHQRLPSFSINGLI